MYFNIIIRSYSISAPYLVTCKMYFSLCIYCFSDLSEGEEEVEQIYISYGATMNDFHKNKHIGNEFLYTVAQKFLHFKYAI